MRIIPENPIFEKFHHGISHSLLFGIFTAVAVSIALFYITGFHSFPLLFFICILSSGSHLLLDALIQNTGIQLLSPFSHKYFSMPILLGKDPLSSYAKCYKKSRFACFKCRFISTVKTPTFIILNSGLLLSVIFSQYLKFFSLSTLSVGICYHLYLFYKRRTVIDSFLRVIGEKEIKKLGVYVPSISPYLWQGIASLNDGSKKVVKMNVKDDKLLLNTHMSVLIL